MSSHVVLPRYEAPSRIGNQGPNDIGSLVLGFTGKRGIKLRHNLGITLVQIGQEAVIYNAMRERQIPGEATGTAAGIALAQLQLDGSIWLPGRESGKRLAQGQ